ncbi:MAG: alpha/beta hydrolase [Acidimicrobiia bacterium]|nr:alpha/beta hydrolase [Acidimicrobiia bacterium]
MAHIVGHLLAPWRRPQRTQWGAHSDEPDPSLAGEDLIADPNWSYTHAIEIDATPEEVWPWVAQPGQGRGGFYSFERLENLFGCRITNTDHILPEHQDIAVGDEIRLHPAAPPMHVAHVDRPRTLVLRGAPHDQGDPDNIWAFHLRETDAGTCRLIERGKSRHGTSVRDRLFFSPLLIEPISFVMSCEMLLGIKHRAERHRTQATMGEGVLAMEPWHPFRSAAAKQEYLAFYDGRAQRWPIPSESTMVSTTFGDTFVRVQGPADGPPLVLLPGDSETSLSWIPVIEAFASEHRVYALDHIYDIGRSIYRRRPRRPGDFVRWLDELFDELQVPDIRLVGHSYGGWMAALYALEFPERLGKLVLVSPPATVLRPPLGLLARAILYGTFPRRSIVRRYLYWYAPDCVRHDATRATIDEMVDEDVLARRCFKRRRFVAPTVLSDEDWQRLAVPTLFLVGRNDVSYSAERAVRRLAAVAPHVKTEITDGDHHLTIVQPDWVIQHVLGFLADR